MGRLPGSDYKRPFFYMVTLRRVRVLQPTASAGGIGTSQTCGVAKPFPFCTISAEGRVVPNAITEVFESVIRKWTGFWRSVESVSPHVVARPSAFAHQARSGGEGGFAICGGGRFAQAA